MTSTPIHMDTSQPVVQTFECPVCFDTPYDPQSMNPCGHTICVSCKEQLKDKECPVCRKRVICFMPNFALRSMLEPTDRYKELHKSHRAKPPEDVIAETPEDVVANAKSKYPDFRHTSSSSDGVVREQAFLIKCLEHHIDVRPQDKDQSAQFEELKNVLPLDYTLVYYNTERALVRVGYSVSGWYYHVLEMAGWMLIVSCNKKHFAPDSF